MYKRFLAGMLTVFVAMSSVFAMGLPACAARSDYSVYHEDYKRALSERCNSFQRYLGNAESKQYGLLFRLRVLSQYMMYTHFMIARREGLGSSSDAQIYERDLAQRVKDFNQLFSKKSEDFTECKLNDNFTGVNDGDTSHFGVSKSAFEDNLCSVIPGYLEKLLKSVQDDIIEAKGDAKKVEEVQKKNTTLLKNIYEIREAVLAAKSDLMEYRPYDSDGKRKSYSVKKDGGEDVVAIFNELAKKYKDLFDIGKTALDSEETDEEITVDLTKSYVDNLSDAVTVSGNVSIPESPSLSMLFYAIMAASSVYVPLQSYAGSSEFQAALKSLTNDDQVQAEIIEFYSAVKDMRKPLYKREFDDNKNPAGTAKLLSIDDFIKDINNGNSGVLCTVLGKFCSDSASNSWIYQQKDFRNTSEYEYEEGEDNSQAGLEENTEDTLDVEDTSVETEDDGRESTSPNSSSTANPILFPAAGVSVGGGFLNNIVLWAKKSVMAFACNFTKTAAASSVDGTDDAAGATESPGPADTAVPVDDSGAQEEGTIDDTAVFAYTEITDATKLSEPVYMYGSDYFRDVDNMTFALFQNAVSSSSNLQRLSNKSTRYLFVNPFGDIVTEDNLVVFPGVANPLIYKSSESYNPYTAAFMNTYPASYKRNASFKLVNKSDIGKFIIVKQTDGGSSAAKDFYAVKTTSICSIKEEEPIKVKKLYRYFSVDGDDKTEMLKYNRLIFGSSQYWNEESDVYHYTPLTNDVTVMAGGTAIFPYVAAEDAGYSAAEAIAKNMFLYLTRDSKGVVGNTHRYNENYLLHYFILNGLDGTNNPKGFSRNSLEQYERYVKSAPERFLDSVKGMVQSVLNFTSGTQGILGLQDSLQSPILGRILIVCRTNLPFFVLIVSLILVYTFAKMRVSLVQALLKWLISIIAAYFSITLVPTYLPMFFNIAINEISENLTYKVLALKTEGEITNIAEPELDQDGEVKLTTGSLTLYRSGSTGYDEFVSMVNVDGSEIVGGNTKVLNQNAGVYVEGDSIKINTSKLFNNLRIAKDDSVGTAADTYQVKAYKTVSDNVDYYMPFYLFTDSFVNELNLFEQVFEVPRGTIIYSNGVIKDDFLVYSFINSQVFISPGDYSTGINTEGLSDVTVKELENSTKALVTDLKQVFGDENKATDFLRLHEWLYEPTDAMKKTLWYKTMVTNGFYDESGRPSKERMEKLISHVNYQTRRFIYSMDDMIGKISDDTVIKLIALRATIDFNQQISDFGHWVYPFSLNYGDLTLKDIAGCIFVSDYSKYTALNLDVVEYMGDTGGWFNLIILCILLVLLFLIAYLVQLLVPVMYVLLCLTVTMKLIVQGDAKSPLKGFAKCTGLIMAGFTLFAFGISITEKLNGSAIGLYVMLFICLFLVYTLFTVITSVLGNVANLGNETVMAKFLPGGFKGFNFSINNLTANRFVTKNNPQHRYRSARHRFGDNSAYNKYRYGSSVYDMYGNGYNRGYDSYGGYDNYGGRHHYKNQKDVEQAASTDETDFDYDKVYDTLDFDEQAQEEYTDLSRDDLD